MNTRTIFREGKTTTIEFKDFPTHNEEKETFINLVILDKSGSMDHLRKAAVDGFNEIIGGIRTAQEEFKDTQEHFVSLMVFCDCDKHFIYENVPIADIKNLKINDYMPCCCTPLYDAMGISLTRLKKQIKDIKNVSVIVTVITDGLENASREYTGDAIKKLVEELTELGWTFAYMGTNHDVQSVADHLSISNVHQFENTDSGLLDSWEMERDANMRHFRMRSEMFEMEQQAFANMPINEARSFRIQNKRNLAKEYFQSYEKPDANRITPDRITTLADNEVFVFGSNVLGNHNGGAAAFALNNFGAVMGQNFGLQGKSFAIPTVGVQLQDTKHFVDEFIKIAKQNPDKRFLVTKIGCGSGNYREIDIAPLFADAKNIENITLPIEFWKCL